jgi:hypothetical protein
MKTVAKMRDTGKSKQKQAVFEGKACRIGVDVHKVSYAAAILDEDGQRLEFSTPASPKKRLMQLTAMGMTIKASAYESGPTGYSLAWECLERGIPVIVAAPSRIPRPVSKTGKTDRLDSMKLVEFLAQDMIKSIAIPSREEFALREIERTRQHLVKQRREVIRNPPRVLTSLRASFAFAFAKISRPLAGRAIYPPPQGEYIISYLI